MTVQIYRIPVLQNNYIFLLHDPTQAIAAVVDPAEAQPVLQLLERLQASLTVIFNTHHHLDHVGANRTLLQRFPQALVYGGDQERGRIPGQTHELRGGDRITFANHQAKVLFVPGHTRAHIAYYFPPIAPPEPRDSATDFSAFSATSGEGSCPKGNPKMLPSSTQSVPLARGSGDLFCGDTLFAGGCGRLSEGTPSQMVNSLAQIRQLPDNTRIWCAHEYTLKNLEFALTIDPDNHPLQQRFKQVVVARQQHHPTIPSYLGLEKQTNLFLRWDQPSLQAAMNSRDPVQTFARLRGKKDLY
jgi:hydroxyacylglutathione hydrolase